MTSPILFILAILVLLFTPGPTNTLLWTSGALVGVRRSLHLLMGELVGYVIAICLVLVIFKSILQHAPYVRTFLALAVGTYIAVLAVNIWRYCDDSTINSDIISFRKVFVVTILNPKSFVFALTIIPIGHPQIHWYFIALSASIFLVGLSWIVFGHIVGSAVGRDKLTLFKRFSSVTLTAFAGYIIVSAIP